MVAPPCVGLLTVSFLSLPLLSPSLARPLALSLAAGISLTFAIGLTRSRSLAQTEGGMDCTREVLMIGNCASILPVTSGLKSDGGHAILKASS